MRHFSWIRLAAFVGMLCVLLTMILQVDSPSVLANSQPPRGTLHIGRALASESASVTNQWYSTLPNVSGGGFAASRQNPLAVFSSGYNGIWKSTNGGESWTQSSTNIPTPYDNQAIWVASDDDQILFVSHFNYGWYRSMDGGNSWQRIFTASAGSVPGWSALAPSNHDVLYIHTYSTVYRTINATSPNPAFQALDVSCQGTIITAVDPTNPDVAYFVGNPTGGVLKTVNGGQSCSQVSPLHMTVHTEFGNGGRLYGYTQNPWNIYTSDDGGSSWTQKAGNGFPTGQDIWGFAIDPADRNHLLVSATNHGIRESRDGGDNWTSLNNGYPIGTERSIMVGFDNPPTYYASTNGSGVWQYHYLPPLSTVSGHVSLSDNSSLGGVLISDGMGHQTTTDSSGNYTLSGLSDGTYTLTPSKSNYSFAPVSSQITVPPNLTLNFVATRLSNGFDYPIGDVYRPTRLKGDSDGRYVVNYFGNQLTNPPCSYQFHPGDDWNRDDEQDVSQPVKAVSDGTVVSIKNLQDKNHTKLGQGIAISHQMTDGSFVYSVYLHVDVGHGINKQTTVKRGDQIATIAQLKGSGLDPHLHFEIRTSFDPKDWYPNDDGCGYYLDLGSLLREGFIDPVDFIDGHRP